MVFCSRRADWSARWHTGDNRSAFETMARGPAHPMGVLAYDGTQPVGWCAVGPRSHYTTAASSRSRVMRGRDPAEDDTVWLVACFFVRVGWRNAGISRRLLDAAVGLGRRSGARAVEGWPRSGGDRRQSDLDYGRETVFARAGFTLSQRPSPKRAVMRLQFDAAHTV